MKAIEVNKDDLLEKAEAEFDEKSEKWSVPQLAEWWKRWYPKLGHKRLGRILINKDE